MAKISKSTEKRLRKLQQDVQKQLFEQILRPKPWWIPRFLHRLGAKIYFKI